MLLPATSRAQTLRATKQTPTTLPQSRPSKGPGHLALGSRGLPQLSPAALPRAKAKRETTETPTALRAHFPLLFASLLHQFSTSQVSVLQLAGNSPCLTEISNSSSWQQELFGELCCMNHGLVWAAREQSLRASQRGSKGSGGSEWQLLIVSYRDHQGIISSVKDKTVDSGHEEK